MGAGDLIENRKPKHKMSNILKRETSQPSNQYEYNQPQGNRGNESEENEPNDHGCLKASIWNLPGDDPRFVIRIGTAKIRSHSEDHKVKTIKDEERDKKQFAMY